MQCTRACLVLGTALGTVLGLLGCGSSAVAPTAAPGLTVTVATVATGTIERWVSLPGTFEARDEAVAAVEGDGGRIVALRVELGDVVSKGQELAVLDDANAKLRQAQHAADVARAQATRAQAVAQVTEADADAAESARSVERLETLAASQSVAAETIGAKRAAQAVSAARATAARAGLAAADAELVRLATVGDEIALAQARTRIVAPAAGLVAIRPARLGQVANPGEVLLTIAVDGVIEFAAEVPEVLLAQIAVGAPVAVTIDGRIHQGTVRRVDPAVDRVSRLGAVRVALSEPCTSRVGASARGRLRLGTADGLVVPVSALLREGTHTLAVVVGPDNVAKRVPVVIGLDDGQRVIITSGLNAGTKIVANAPGFVTDGTHVATAE